jgi:hypothetical protein
MEIQFDEKKHQYTIRGRLIPNVSSIVKILDKPMLNKWAIRQAISYIRKNKKKLTKDVFLQAENEAKRVKEKAGEKGTELHKIIEEWLNGGGMKKPRSKHLASGLQKFIKWAENKKMEVLHSEKKVYSKSRDYAGTCDIVAKIDGRLSLLDIKTGKNIYQEAYAQVAAYGGAWNEEFPNNKIKDFYIIQISSKNGNFRAERVKNIKRHYKSFLAMKFLYEWQKDLASSKFNKKSLSDF